MHWICPKLCRFTSSHVLPRVIMWGKNFLTVKKLDMGKTGWQKSLWNGYSNSAKYEQSFMLWRNLLLLFYTIRLLMKIQKSDISIFPIPKTHGVSSKGIKLLVKKLTRKTSVLTRQSLRPYCTSIFFQRPR